MFGLGCCAELSKDCVCFANEAGGRIFIGIEEGDLLPPPGQRIEPSLMDRVRKRIGELTVNVQVLSEVQRCENGGEVLVIRFMSWCHGASCIPASSAFLQRQTGSLPSANGRR